jgi:6-phosphogluconolactonase
VHVIVARDLHAAAQSAAAAVAEACGEAVRERGRALVAFSGGDTPWRMLAVLGHLDVPWGEVWVAQVDERVAPAGDPRRNALRLREILVEQGQLPAANLLQMPVEQAHLDAAAAQFQATLESIAGKPMRLDLVQLGLGADGHTASLVPGDAVLDVSDRDVAMTAPYQGTRRMTLTFPALDRARARLWLVTGASKRAVLEDLVEGVGSSPAVRVARDSATIITDLAIR